MSPEPDSRHAIVAQPGSGASMWYLGGVATVKMTEEQTGSWAVLLESFPAGFASGMHTHTTEDKLFYIISGEMVVKCGDIDATAPPGSCVFLPRGVPHAFKAGDAAPVTWLNVQATGDFRKLADEIGTRAPGHVLPPNDQTRTDPAVLAEAGRRHHLELLGPPPF